MERIRAFLALNLPVAAIDKVGKLQRELRDAAVEQDVQVSWVPPPNMHVTLKFLGQIPIESAHAVRNALSDRLAGREGWQVQVGGVGVFPDASRPRVVWAGLHDKGELQQLAEQVEQWLQELGFEPETKPFHAHVTLGRVKHGTANFWQPWEQREIQRCAPSEVVLYRSDLQRNGAEYTALARIPLGTSDSNER